MVKEIRKTSVIKFKKKSSLKLKFRSLFLKIKKTPAYWRLRFSNMLGESNHLNKSNALACTCRNPAGLGSRPELDLPFCSHGNGKVRLRTGAISGVLFRTTRILDLFGPVR